MDECIICGEELWWIDDDPNGDKNCKCKRCVAEEEHDYDLEPNAVFNRCGDREDLKVSSSSDEQYIFDMLSRKTIRRVERQDSTRISIFFTDGTGIGFSAFAYPIESSPWEEGCSVELELETF